MRRKFHDRLSDRITNRFSAVSSERRTVLDGFFDSVTFHAWQVQEHCKPCRAFDQSADRGAAETEDEITFPVTGHRSVADLRGTVADHQCITKKGLTTATSPFARQPKRSTGTQAGR